MNPVEPFLILLIAHLIGDFVLQTEQMALKKGHVLGWLILHASELGLITWLLCWTGKVWPVVFVVFLTHVVFDWIKPRLPGSPLRWYIVDQAAHITVLWVCALWISNRMVSMPLTDYIPFPILAILTAYLFVGRPLTIGMGLFLKPWQEEVVKSSNHSESCSITGLTRSGEWIGNLERFFVLTCVLADQFILVGMILIAKAVMRFGETGRPEQRKRADYVLLGSLGSFGLAFLVGVLIRHTL